MIKKWVSFSRQDMCDRIGNSFYCIKTMKKYFPQEIKKMGDFIIIKRWNQMLTQIKS